MLLTETEFHQKMRNIKFLIYFTFPQASLPFDVGADEMGARHWSHNRGASWKPIFCLDSATP
jgi:hypothetical protein